LLLVLQLLEQLKYSTFDRLNWVKAIKKVPSGTAAIG